MSSVRSRHPAPTEAMTPTTSVTRLGWAGPVASPYSGGEGELVFAVGFGTGGEVELELALDALEGVVDRLHVAVEAVADLLVALTLHVEGEHVHLELGQDLGEATLHGREALGGDEAVRGV